MAFLNGNGTSILEYPYDSNYCTIGDMEVELVFRIETIQMNDTNARALIGITAPASPTSSVNASFGLAWYQGKLRLIHESGSKVLYQSDTTTLSLPIEKWHHIKVQRIGLQYIIYQNGVEVERKNFATAPTGISSTLTSARIGYINYMANNSTQLSGRGSIIYAKITALPQVKPLVFGKLPPAPTKPILPGISNFGTPTLESLAVRQKQKYNGSSVKVLDDIGSRGIRITRRNSGFQVMPKEGTDGGGETINTPRRSPLEISWKKANPTFFK